MYTASAELYFSKIQLIIAKNIIIYVNLVLIFKNFFITILTDMSYFTRTNNIIKIKVIKYECTSYYNICICCRVYHHLSALSLFYKASEMAYQSFFQLYYRHDIYAYSKLFIQIIGVLHSNKSSYLDDERSTRDSRNNTFIYPRNTLITFPLQLCHDIQCLL